VRVGVVESILDTPIEELAEEVRGAAPIAYVKVFLEGMRAAVAEPSFVADTERRLGALMDEVGDGTFGDWLDEVALRDVWADSTVALMTERLRVSVQTESFAGWWETLHA